MTPPVPDLLEFLGGDPEERLIVYGSLAPGGVNNFILARLGGSWHRCTIRGRIRMYRGFRAFKYDPDGEEQPAWLFTSPALRLKFPDLDDFEGDDYRRIVIPARVGGQDILANVYEGKHLD
jgi:gamma-glutamylcyclotransferase (GGCT)/AIG2-like uncharacterized protein YtfP